MGEQFKGEVELRPKIGSNNTKLKKLGVTLIILSCVFYCSLLLVPFTPYSFGTKAIISSILVVSGEASFWIGGFILGKEIVQKYRKYLNPFNWFKRKAN